MPRVRTYVCRSAALALLVVAAFARTSGPAVHAQISSCTSNRIVCENANTGSPRSEWDVVGAGDPTIQGFATDTSVDHGRTVHFKIKTDATDYQIAIYRMGYYGGMGARRVATIAPGVPLPQSQPACLNDASTGLIDCGNWSESASWAMPASAPSGIYFAKLTRTDTGGASHIIFIVRDDGTRSDLVFQTSDTTWQAYNRYGGNSLYVGGPGNTPSRAYKVSYNRPITTRGTTPENSVFNAEYPMVRWLEANGYDVSYISGVDTDRSGATILTPTSHTAFLSVGHDEYWSATQRANVEAARAAGVHLAFFSGNEMYWKVRWEPSIDGAATPYRTLVSYKETHANAQIDPSGIWTGTWRDPRFSPPADGGRPENALTGTLFTVQCCQPRFPSIVVPADAAGLRFWRNTPVAASGGGALLPRQSGTGVSSGGVLGFEFDEDVDNGFRPAGLMRLSSTTTQVDEKLVDYGSTYRAGSATHALTLYRDASGVLVFGAGTVQWSWGLDNAHDRLPDLSSDYTNDSIQQATVNLLADMGSQPGSLQPGLSPAVASADVVPPTSTITSPVTGGSVASGTTVTISGTASDTNGRVAAVEVSVDGGVTWNRAAGRDTWTYAWQVMGVGAVTLKSRAIDDSGNIEMAPVSKSVTVNCPCSLWNPTTTIPATIEDADTSAVEVGLKFRTDVSGYITGIRFYKSAANVGTHVGHIYDSAGALLASATFTGETASGWQQVIFGSPVKVVAGFTYIASYHTEVGHYSATVGYFATSGVDTPPLHALSNIVSENGVYQYGDGGFPAFSYNATNYWVDVIFATSVFIGEGGVPTPPVVTGVTPAPGATGVGLGTTVTVTFSEPMAPSTISTSTIELRNAANAVVAGSVGYNDTTRTATFVPSVSLTPSSTYTVVVRGGSALQPRVADTSGDSLVANFTSSFTTAAPVACPCSIWDPATAVPEIVDTGDADAVELGVKVRPDGDGFISGLRFYKSAANTGVHVANLWTSAGALLATATFSGETASGWQEVAFAAPVAVSANTVYVASYHTNSGHYSLNTAHFASAGVDSPPLHALANDASANGVFHYGPSAFPDSSYNSSNYWVDVVYTTIAALPADTTPPAVASTSPSAGATGVPIDSAVSVTFTEALDISTINGGTFDLRDGGGVPVSATVFYDPATRIAKLTPSALLSRGVTYTVRVRGGAADPRVKDLSGNALAADVTWTFTTYAPGLCPCSLWNFPTIGVADAGDANAVELGVKFRADFDGFVTGVRYYKSAANSGTHIGNLWASTGARLATATFTNETATGWQTVTFSTPVAVTANTVYIASYHTDTGHYAATEGYFGIALDSPPLHAIANNVGVNGVYRYGVSGFPSSSFNSSNYWVDVVFMSAAAAPADTTPPTLTNFFPPNAPETSNYSGIVPVSVTATDNVSVVGVQFKLDGANLGAEDTTSPYGVSWDTKFSANGSHLLLAVARDAAGNTATVSSVVNSSNGSPAVVSLTPVNGSVNVSRTPTVIATFNQAMDPATVNTTTFTLADASNALVPGTVTYDGAALTATFTPSAPLAPGATYIATVRGQKNLNGEVIGFAGGGLSSFTITTDLLVTTFVDTTAVDFSKGTLDTGGYIGGAGDGELILTPWAGSEFSGTALPFGWLSSPWTGTPSAAVSGGVMAVDGAIAYSNTLYRSLVLGLDFTATFSGAPYQHAGFAVTLTDGVWAMFSTGPGNGLYARTNNGGGAALDTLIPGKWFGAPHVFRIVWNSTSVVYFVDGVQVASHGISIGSVMRPMASDYTGDGNALKIDWMRMWPYVQAGTFTSAVFDAGAPVAWQSAAWRGTSLPGPTGTGVVLSVRYGDTATPDASWTPFTTVTGGTLSGTSRYLQYRLQLSTSDATQTPVVNDVTVTFAR